MQLVIFDELKEDWETLEASKAFVEAMNEHFNFDRGGIELRNAKADTELILAFSNSGEQAATRIIADIATNGVVYIDRIKE